MKILIRVLGVAVALLGTLQTFATEIYFTGTQSPAIWKGDADGAMPMSMLYLGSDASSGPSGPIGIAEANGELFWGTGNNEEVRKGKADGSGTPVVLANSGPTPPNSPFDVDERHDVAIDIANNRYFFTDAEDGIYMAAMDGSGVPMLVTNDVFSKITSITYDSASDFIYYSDIGGEVNRVKPDGSAKETLHSGLNGIRDITIDFSNGAIYFVNNDIVGRLNLDGTGVSTTLYDPFNFVRSIDIDVTTNELFWITFDGPGSTTNDSVQKASADGLGTINTLYSGSFGGLRGIAVQRPAVVVSEPSIIMLMILSILGLLNRRSYKQRIL
ncbi:hypothetical protein [Flocculibacter collagenilyticus]|uniref:hypothetical protein n=1 Tax=Flocculibacter collagenilyticus TaxID=2744479 RepID=UPI0018F45B3A|nr:hypothetical protein [Flocculibacter collagenilyticus]